ncbi:MAG: protein kinase, partial [Elainella sp. Prado103]|nr:protein kinase [Elainella sp. Prado103]
MSLVYCSQGHANVSTHRFCSTCGEKLAVSTLLGNRYQIIQELGRGGFGRTYLAKDRNRFDETCVLKEFAPQVQGSEALQKAEELFAREAGVLYSLYHPQIPRFRELFRATWEGRDRLFLVQDYVEGLTYRQLLDARKLEDRLFSEQEGRQLLAQLLPVLDYIHRMGVIHRDISPENLIHRSNDQIPVLIDFGGVKQVAATATKKYVQQSKPPVSESTLQAAAVTRLGKVGYAPIEQIESGTVSPQSDLYALAVTVLVLCSGQEPPVLIDPTGRSTPWLSQLSLSPDFTTVLGRMLTDQPDRFSSAAEVWQALQPFSPKLPDARMGYGAGQPIAGQPIAGQPIAPATNHSPPGFASPVSAAPVFTNPQATYPVAQPGNSFAVGQLNTGQLNTGQLNTGQSGQPSHSIPIRPVRFQGWKTVLWFLLPISLGVGLALTAGWWLQQAGWFPDFTLQPDSSPNSPSPDSSSPDSLSPLEQAAQTAGIDYGFLVQLTD